MPPPTDEQWAELSHAFPSLIRVNVIVTDNPTATYNCIAFSLGVLDSWINPPDPLSAFQALYNGAPYNHPTVATGDVGAQIDGWALPAIGPGIAETTHGSRRYVANPTLWESKLGQSYRITHGRDELQGVAYGRIVTSFT